MSRLLGGARPTPLSGSGPCRGREELATLRAFDDYVHAILDELSARGMTRADLARAADMQAANLRRLLTDAEANPTFATLVKVTDALRLDTNVVRRGDRTPAG